MEGNVLPKGMTGQVERRDSSEKKVRLYEIVVLISLVSALVLFIYAGYFTREYAVNVTTVHEAYPYQMFTSLKAEGKVVIGRKVALAPRIPGELAEVMVGRGSIVRKGQLVARLENTEAMLSREQGEANLRLARANLEQANILLGEAEAAYGRSKELHAKGSVPDSEYRSSEHQLRKARSALSIAQASVSAQVAGLRRAELLLGYTSIRAPFDGIVLSMRVHPGDMVRPIMSETDGAGGILTLADLGSLEVEVQVPESEMRSITTGQPCGIVLDPKEASLKGEVETVQSPVGKGSAVVRVAILDRNPKIMPDMNAEVAFLVRQISSKENKPLVAVERSALTPCRGGYSVFKVSGDRVVEKVVRLGRQFKDEVEVIGGIALGDTLVKDPPDGLKTGSRISVRKD